jgi:flagellar basal body rod protein FlgB
MEKLFNKTINSLANTVGVRAQKHRVILSNVANIDTPGGKLNANKPRTPGGKNGS